MPAIAYGQLLEVPQGGEAATKTFLIETSKPKAVVLLFGSSRNRVGKKMDKNA